LPAHKGASGGSKIIYTHSKIINKLNINNISSQVLHLKKSRLSKLSLSLKKKIFKLSSKKYGWNLNDMKAAGEYAPSSSWNKNKIEIKKDFNLNPKTDFLIIPEIWGHFGKQILIDKKIKYAIFVQGFYHMNSSYNHKKLFESYSKAKYIITTSAHTLENLKYMFPKLKNKILKVNISFDFKKFKIPNKKNNLITFMPRKLPDHYHILSLFLSQKLPKKWKIESLSNLDEKKLLQKMCKSKIFLSFSHLEGFGLPPIEAAIAGNKVIGYPGGGGSEYWKKPIFEKIESGDIKDFCQKILETINYAPKNWHKKTYNNRKKIIKKYSSLNEIKSIKKLIHKVHFCYK